MPKENSVVAIYHTHAGAEEAVKELQRGGVAPTDMEYEECPRGRVMYDTTARRFQLLADKCILKNKGMVTMIFTTMKLSRKNTDIGTDNHYRCFACLHSRTEDPD